MCVCEKMEVAPHCRVLLYCYLTRLTSRKADSKSMSQYKDLKTAGRGARSTIAVWYVQSVIVMQRTLSVLLIRERVFKIHVVWLELLLSPYT